ncbi:MAG: helix-turn-helix domain-containing protein [candidate division Zixibacteria bacterium]|nr:helix-turn-helix domain-containing protein [candidate division Zixibacteria bacterium]
MEKEFYTVKELAALLELNQYTIYRMVDRGELPVHIIGNSKRFRRSDVEDYLSRVRGLGKDEIREIKKKSSFGKRDR